MKSNYFNQLIKGGNNIVTDLETICIQHTDVPKVSYVVKYVCSQIPFLLSSGRIKGVRCDFFELGYYI